MINLHIIHSWKRKSGEGWGRYWTEYEKRGFQRGEKRKQNKGIDFLKGGGKLCSGETTDRKQCSLDSEKTLGSVRRYKCIHQGYICR